MTIVLVVALLAGASPARSAVRPNADPHPVRPAALTPLPLAGGMPLFESDEPEPPVDLYPAAGPSAEARPAGKARAGAAARRPGGSLLPLFAVAGIGAVLAFFATLLIAGRPPRQSRPS